MDLKTSGKVLTIVFLAGAAALAGWHLFELRWLIYAFLGLMLVGCLLSVALFRCPVCRRYLGRSAGSRFCPHCGARLKEG